MQVKDLTVEELKSIIQETVAEMLQSLKSGSRSRQRDKTGGSTRIAGVSTTNGKRRKRDSRGRGGEKTRIELVMAYRVEFTREAIAELGTLAPPIQERVS